MRFLANLFVLVDDERLREIAQAVIKAFPENLPSGSKTANDQEQVAELRRTAEIWSEFGKIENYAMTPAPDGSSVYIEMRSPKAADPDVVAVQERQSRMHRQLTLLNWVTQSLEKKELSDSLGVIDVIEQAKAIDRPDLFDIPHETADPDGMDQSAVAGVAAVALLFGGELGDAQPVWAQEAVSRAAETPEKRDALWFAGSKLLYHPCVYAVNGLKGLICRGIDPRASKHALLRLHRSPAGRSIAHGDRSGASSGCGRPTPSLRGPRSIWESVSPPRRGTRFLPPTGMTTRPSPTASALRSRPRSRKTHQ